jgi:hypothetical protein
MRITINVRPSCGSYVARALGLGVTASSAEGPAAAARAVCRKLDMDANLLERSPSEDPVTKFTHPGSDTEVPQP